MTLAPEGTSFQGVFGLNMKPTTGEDGSLISNPSHSTDEDNGTQRLDASSILLIPTQKCHLF